MAGIKLKSWAVGDEQVFSASLMLDSGPVALPEYRLKPTAYPDRYEMVRSALVFYLRLSVSRLGRGERVAWLIGEIPKALATKLGLELRRRAPGGGRPESEPDGRLTKGTYWLSKAGKAAIKAAAQAEGIAEGKAIEARFLPP